MFISKGSTSHDGGVPFPHKGYRYYNLRYISWFRYIRTSSRTQLCKMSSFTSVMTLGKKSWVSQRPLAISFYKNSMTLKSIWFMNVLLRTILSKHGNFIFISIMWFFFFFGFDLSPRFSSQTLEVRAMETITEWTQILEKF